MKFYELDGALQEAIGEANKPVKLKVEIDNGDHFESVFEQDIIEADFWGLKEAAGGTSARGEILINNEKVKTNKDFFSGREVRVSFTLGDTLPYFQRFRFYIDDKGVQDIRGAGRKRCIKLDLRDLSYKLRKSEETRDWTLPAVFTYSVVCDKSQPQKSLVHGIAQRAGLYATDIDCSTIPVTLPYIKLRRNIWAELSSLATANRCHLECPVEKPLVFAHSPYQLEQLEENECSYTFYADDLFYFRKIDKAELYRNSVRLKINMPVSLEKQEIWRYSEAPVFYDEFLQPYYPFKNPLNREIETGKYEANYKIVDENGKERNVVYADQVDSQSEAENSLEYDGGAFSYSFYDITTNHDKALLTLQKESDGDLCKAVIHGRPIILDLNRSCYLSDSLAVAEYGTVALNVTGSYFSEYEIRGKPHYEDWVIRELVERLQNKREFVVKTHSALFNARVGANVRVFINSEQREGGKITEKNKEYEGEINAFHFRYRKNEAFVSSFRIIEKEVNYDG